MDRQITLAKLQEMKQAGEKIVSLTAYDASFANIVDSAGVEIILVGDSLGMVLHGQEDTLAVTIDNMIYHSRIVAGSCQHALLVTDMPYLSYESKSSAYNNARRLVDEGKTAVVKIEGGVDKAEIAAHLVNSGIPVCGHIGLQPQSVKEYGGYKVQGRNENEAAAILAGARVLEEAGVSMIVLECIPEQLAAQVTDSISIPTIGIGAGVNCDGQVLVIYDLLGISKRTPHMAKNFMQQAASIEEAIEMYIWDVKNKIFPGSEHAFQ